MTLEDLVTSIRIEEGNISIEKKATRKSSIMGANIVQIAPTKSKKRKEPSRVKIFFK